MSASGSEGDPVPRKRKYEDEIDDCELLVMHRLLELEPDDFDELPEEIENNIAEQCKLVEDDSFAEEIVGKEEKPLAPVAEEDEEDPFAVEFDFPYDDDYLVQLAQPQTSEKKNPLFIAELIQEILGYLDTPTLKICRLVCPQWDENASHLLLKGNKLQIIVKYRDKIRRPKLRNGYTLSDLTNYMSRSMGGTPTLSFHINTNYFHECEVQTWLNEYGIQIKELYIECHQPLHYNYPFMIEQLRLLFNRQAPNLQQLTFELSKSNYLPSGESTTVKRAKLKLVECNRGAPMLTNLRKLTIKNVTPSTKYNNIEVLQDFMTSAINLKEIQVLSDSIANDRSSVSYCRNTEFADSLIATQKISAVKKAVVAPRPVTMYSLIKFSEAQPYNLENLTIQLNDIILHPQKYEEMAMVLNNIFKASHLSLRSLTMEPLSFLPGLTVPTLPHVTDLCLKGTRKLEVVSILPPSTRHHHHELYNIFPNLRKLKFCDNLGGLLLDNCLASFTSSTITTLPLMTEVTVLTWPIGDGQSARQHLSNLFPNLQKLVIRPSVTRFDLPLFIRHIVQNFPRLKFLKLQNFELRSGTKRNFTKSSFELDSVLTGISVDTMKKKKRQITKAMKDPLEDLDPWITEPSLDNLVDLASFELELSVGLWSQFRTFSTRNSHPLFSMSLGALKRIPTIKVTLTGDMEENEWGCRSRYDFTEEIKSDLASFLGSAQSIVEIGLRNFFSLMPSDSDLEDDDDDDDDDYFEHYLLESFDDYMYPKQFLNFFNF